MIEPWKTDTKERGEASSPNILVGLGNGLQQVDLSLLPSVEKCPVEEMSGILPGGKDRLPK